MSRRLVLIALKRFQSISFTLKRYNRQMSINELTSSLPLFATFTIILYALLLFFNNFLTPPR
jgi:hypothetical protein